MQTVFDQFFMLQGHGSKNIAEELVFLTHQWPTFARANAQKKTPFEIHFICLGNKEIYCIFKTCCVVSVLLSRECRLFHNYIFFCSNNTFFINHVQKFKYQPSLLKVNTV
jgi:hypothetical protein